MEMSRMSADRYVGAAEASGSMWLDRDDKDVLRGLQAEKFAHHYFI